MENYFEEKRGLADRRKFTYTSYCPERRTGIDRRTGFSCADGMDRIPQPAVRKKKRIA